MIAQISHGEIAIVINDGPRGIGGRIDAVITQWVTGLPWTGNKSLIILAVIQIYGIDPFAVSILCSDAKAACAKNWSGPRERNRKRIGVGLIR